MERRHRTVITSRPHHISSRLFYLVTRESPAPSKGCNFPGVLRGILDPFALTAAADNIGISAGLASPAPDRPSHELRLVAIRSEDWTRIRGFIMGVTDVCFFGDFRGLWICLWVYETVKDLTVWPPPPKSVCTQPTVA